MSKYSAISILRNAVSGHRGWGRAWRDAEPNSHYDVVVIGAGGHGLATAAYLAGKQGISSVAVLEKGYLGGGNTGRNTQVCRSNYFYPESGAFYEHSLKLFEHLAQRHQFQRHVQPARQSFPFATARMNWRCSVAGPMPSG